MAGAPPCGNKRTLGTMAMRVAQRESSTRRPTIKLPKPTVAKHEKGEPEVVRPGFWRTWPRTKEVEAGPVNRIALRQVKDETVQTVQTVLRATYLLPESASRPLFVHGRRVKTPPTAFHTLSATELTAPRFTWLALKQVPEHFAVSMPLHIPLPTCFQLPPALPLPLPPLPSTSPRTLPPMSPFEYVNPRGLYDFQKAAVDAMEAMIRDVGGAHGVIPCGMGKTEVIGALISRFGIQLERSGREAWIIAPKLNIEKQTAAKFRERFPHARVGVYDGGSKAPEGTHIVVATMQSLVTAPEVVRRRIGLLGVDEVHHVPATTMFTSLSSVDAPLGVFGLTATRRRGDCFECVIDLLVGPLAFHMHRPWAPVAVCQLQVPPVMLKTQERLSERGVFLQDVPPPDVATFGDALASLAYHAGRNALIERCVYDVAQRVRRSGGRVLVLLDRGRHTVDFARASGAYVHHTTEARQTETDRKAKGVPVQTMWPHGHVHPDWSSLRTALYMGTQTEREREECLRICGVPLDGDAGTGRTDRSLPVSVLWSTNSMAQEGMDFDSIHAVCIFTKQCEWPEQQAGRGLRMTSKAALPELYILKDDENTGAGGNFFTNISRSQIKYMREEERWPVVILSPADVHERRTCAHAPVAPTEPFVPPMRSCKKKTRSEDEESENGEPKDPTRAVDALDFIDAI